MPEPIPVEFGGSQPNDGSKASYPRRFSWPMRLFLCAFVGDMFVRSLLSLTPYDKGWNSDLSVELCPQRLPTAAEVTEIAAAEGISHETAYWRRLRECGASVVLFFSPIPSPETREKLDEPLDVGKYAIVWTASRLSFFGSLFGVDQDWPMFSPSVGTNETLGRLRLVFADGSTRIWHTCADPKDILSYAHWYEEKHLQTATKLVRDHDAQRGYCNWVAHQVPANEHCSPLVRIEIFAVYYDYPAPSEDARERLTPQAISSSGPAQQPIWFYDVATSSGKRLR